MDYYRLSYWILHITGGERISRFDVKSAPRILGLRHTDLGSSFKKTNPFVSKLHHLKLLNLKC
jgi:hypothetical protein